MGDGPCSWFGRLTIATCQCCPSDLQMACNPSPYTTGLFCLLFLFYRNRKVHPKIHMRSEGTLNNKNNLKNKVGGHTFPDCKATVTKDRRTDQWHGIDSPEINCWCLIGHLLTKAPRPSMGKSQSSPMTGARKTGYSLAKE